MTISNNIRKLEYILSSLPGLGPKTIKRLALHLLTLEPEERGSLLKGVKEVCDSISVCKCCGCLSEKELCTSCEQPFSEDSVVCIVETLEDMLSMQGGLPKESTFHVLGGKLSPLHGIGPEELNISSLINKLDGETVLPQEIIIGTGADVEGEATASYIASLLKDRDIRVTRIAFGLSVGSSLSRSSEKSIQKSIAARTLY